MPVWERVGWAVAAALLVSLAVRSAVGTIVVPRGVPNRLTRVVFVVVLSVFRLRVRLLPRRRRDSETGRDRVLVFFAPTALLTLQGVWLLITAAAAVCAFRALGTPPVRSVQYAGSALTTLGFSEPAGLGGHLVAFGTAGTGLALLTLLITYLPSLYAAFSRREQLVRKLEVRAGSPPSGVALLERSVEAGREAALAQVWRDWEDWFVDLEESHTSFAALAFFRSPTASLSWVTAGGAILDAAALLLAVRGDPRRLRVTTLAEEDLDVADPVGAEVCLRSGALALRRIASYYALPLPTPGHVELFVSREEFCEVYDRLAAGPVLVDVLPDDAWEAFQNWRGRYDAPLVELAPLVQAPPAPWSGDRAGRARGRGLTLRVRQIDEDPQVEDLVLHRED